MLGEDGRDRDGCNGQGWREGAAWPLAGFVKSEMDGQHGGDELCRGFNGVGDGEGMVSVTVNAATIL